MPAGSWTPATDLVTTPDQLDEEAFRALGLMDDEAIVSVWQTVQGFLILTSLRVVSVWRRAHLFGAHPDEWKEGPTFLFYNLNPPRVVASRFVELSERVPEGAGFARFHVRDPDSVSAAIAAAIPAGDRAWRARREQVRARLDQARKAARAEPPGVVIREVVREVVRVPCRYCGTLMRESAARCPNCGAPPH